MHRGRTSDVKRAGQYRKAGNRVKPPERDLAPPWQQTRRTSGLKTCDGVASRLLSLRMPSPLTIWTNRAPPADAAADFERRLEPHRIIRASNLAATNLVAAANDPALVDRCDVALGQPTVDDILAAKKLKLVCLSSAGYTRYDRDDLRAHCKKKDIALCNASMVYAEPCSQHVLAFMLCAARRLPDSIIAQLKVRDRMMAQSFRRSNRDKPLVPEAKDDHWDTLPVRAASVLIGPGTSVLVVGYGSIGRRIVELLTPLRPNIRALRRSPRGDENCPTSPISEIDQFLPDADDVINLLPLNDDTQQFFDAKRLGKMKRGARFYNIGRGDTVDQPALIRALVSGQIAQAYLDVTSPEPLPPENPLWLAPNCYITPHTAGGSADESERQTQHFIENVKRFERGDTLVDRVF